MDSQSFIDSSFANINVLEELYEKYQLDPKSVDAKFQAFFQEVDRQQEYVPLPPQVNNEQQMAEAMPAICHPFHAVLRISKLINAYRTYGHLYAKVNPIATKELQLPWQLHLETLGFSQDELDHPFSTCGIMDLAEAPLREIIATLQKTYCGNIGVEYMGVQNAELEEWLQHKIEHNHFSFKLTIDQKRMILQHLNKSELFESFLHTKYVGQKRFSLEGGETLIPILADIVETGAQLGLEEFVIGMAHRGRLNVLSNILDKSYSTIFSEFEDRWIPNSFEGSGDVKYHKGFSSVITTEAGKTVQIDLTPNPSHLEGVNPVVEGVVRAKQDKMNGPAAKDKIIPILIHGDAAISGQGIVYETLQMYNLDGYSTGGTIHLVINNQVGFTTSPKDDRSTLYCTDIARAFNAPVFHVNAEDPEGCIHAATLAVAIRQKFHCDVFIDIYCYRKYGHNETDEPAFTQPLEYRIIRTKKPIREIYRDDLIQQGILERHMAEALEADFKAALQQALDGPRFPGETDYPEPVSRINRQKTEDDRQEMLRPVKTGVEGDVLKTVGERITFVPEGFNIHKKLVQLNNDRRAMANGEKPVDWGMGELLAYGTLLWEGTHVRLAGQDCGRGTFSHRHAMWVDQEAERYHDPLNHLKSSQGTFTVINSLLSEYGALGFEFGYSLGAPDSLILWEAQFGDFANGAQVIIDQFIASSEQKWGQKNNVTLLLPHGYEGQGPEHSSARIERFLTLSADNNMFVVNPSTPAQLFHLLRRQVLRRSPKPLIVFTPKALLRHPECVSTIQDLENGSFEEVIDDPKSPDKVQKLVFCSGKVYYDLIKEREERGAADTAFVRIEQLYPLHEEKIVALLKAKYSNVSAFFWAQEEPENKGAWRNILQQLTKLLPKDKTLTYVGRTQSAASATGSIKRHKQEYQEMMDLLFGEKTPEKSAKGDKGKK